MEHDRDNRQNNQRKLNGTMPCAPPRTWTHMSQTSGDMRHSEQTQGRRKKNCRGRESGRAATCLAPNGFTKHRAALRGIKTEPFKLSPCGSQGNAHNIREHFSHQPQRRIIIQWGTAILLGQIRKAFRSFLFTIYKQRPVKSIISRLSQRVASTGNPIDQETIDVSRFDPHAKKDKKSENVMCNIACSTVPFIISMAHFLCS